MLDRLGEIQLALQERDLEGWLFYDFRGSNHLACRALGLKDVTLTRRFFYWIPAVGVPALIVHETEAHVFPAVPGERIGYTGWTGLREALTRVLPTEGRLLMEYCPMGSNPYLSLVDGGTVELVRSYGPTVLSSGDLVQRFVCVWTPEQRESHIRAAAALARAKDDAVDHLKRCLEHGRAVSESQLQRRILGRFEEDNMESGGPPIVSFGVHTADPHYQPDAASTGLATRGDLVMLDLSARENIDEGVFADLTWMAFVGDEVPAEIADAFAVLVAARDRVVELIRTRHAARKRMLGFEMDRAAREVVARAGHADRFIHRTGHYLGSVMNSGDACTFDDYEIHDTRELMEGLAWAIHPGLYFADWGMRTALSLYLGPGGPEVHTPVQAAVETVFT